MFPASMAAPLLPFHSLRLWMVLVLSFLMSYPLVVLGLVNVTVEHGDPQISYGPRFDVEWKEGWPGVMKSSGVGAEATFTFTGTALFYEGWLWSTPTLFQAQIDDGTPITIDLTDQSYTGDRNVTAVPTTLKTIFLWPLPGVVGILSENQTEISHTIVFSKTGEQREIIIGKLIYSTDNPPPTVAANPGFAPTATASSQPSPNAVSSTSKNLKIILPAALGGAAVLTACLLACWIRRRRRPPRVRFDVPVVTKTTMVTQDQPQMKHNGSKISLRGVVDHVWDPKVIQVQQVNQAAHPNWRIE